MKKKSLIGLLAVAACLISCSDSSVKVNMKMKNADDKMVYLTKYEGEAPVAIDSAIVKDGMVVFDIAQVEQNDCYYLSVKDSRGAVLLFPENNDITVDVDLKSIGDATVSGSSSNDLYKEYGNVIDELDDKIGEQYSIYKDANKKNDKALMEKCENIIDSLDKKQMEYIVDFVKGNSDNVVAHYVLYRNNYMFELEDLSDMVKDAKATSYFLDKLNDRIAVLQSVAIGKNYVDFTMADVDGNMVSLSELVGKSKLLLVDFWASWCGPCRAENPHVVATYNEYHGQGFDVLGVSLDNSKENWLKAIEDDNLTWKHLSDLQGWGNSAAKLYGVNSIPSNVLLDENGVIVAKNLRGDDLSNKVNELLNK